MFKLNAKFDANLLLYLLSHLECNGHTAHILTQWCLLPHPHWLVQWSHQCSHMCIPVYSSWLTGYISVAQTVLTILTMARLFLDRPCIYPNRNEVLFTTHWQTLEAEVLLKRKELIYSKAAHFVRMTGFCLRAPPLQNTQRKITLLPFIRPIWVYNESSFSHLKQHSLGNCRMLLSCPPSCSASFSITVRLQAPFWSLRAHNHILLTACCLFFCSLFASLVSVPHPSGAGDPILPCLSA